MASSNEFQSVLRSDSLALIQDGSTLSNAVDLHGTVLIGISIPAGFSGTTLTVYASTSYAGTYQQVRNTDNVAATITCAAGYYYALVPFDLAGCRYVKLQSNTTQSGDCTITLVTRPI